MDVQLLRDMTEYRPATVTSSDPMIGWFWSVIEGFTEEERALFLRFVWGRLRLPRTKADFPRKMIVQVEGESSAVVDGQLPSAMTCFFQLKLPRYSKRDILQHKLGYAIHFCRGIDLDNYARTELPAQQPAALDASDSSDEEDAHQAGVGGVSVPAHNQVRPWEE